MAKVMPALFTIPIDLVGGIGAVQLPPGLTETPRERSTLGRVAFCQRSYLMSPASGSARAKDIFFWGRNYITGRYSKAGAVDNLD
jgi:hypothetical protein